MSRRKIHTQAKILASLKALPAEYKNKIHPSQLKRYECINPSDYFGHELSEVMNKEIEWIRRFGDFPKAKQISVGILKLFVFFRATIEKVRGFKTALQREKSFFVELAQRFKSVIPVHYYSRLIGLSESTLHNWIRQVRVKCSDSLINTCRKVHPNQLLLPEARKIKKLLHDDEYKYWPLRSLYYFALKNKILSMGQSTWYKYAHLLNINRLKPKTVKIKSTGIRAINPNELWHADVTYFFTPSKVKLYIYTVIDNFSRFPLCIKVSEKLCGKFRVQTFRDALKRAVEINPSVENLKLMTDGGSENFNGTVAGFLNSVDKIEIKHIKALSDGWPSNSMAEAFNYTLKLFYLNHMDIRNLASLNKALEFIANDYAFKRPHGKLNGLTPFEAYTGQRPADVSFVPQIEIARKIRVSLNQNHNCTGKCNFK